MEHEQHSDLYDPEHHHEHEIDATLEVSYEASHDAHEDPQDYPQPQPQPQPQQSYPQQFQPRSPAPPPRRAPPSQPAQQAQRQYPNQQQRAYQPQPNPQYYPQPGYAPAPAYPVQAPPQNYQTHPNQLGYTKPHQPHSPYNPNAGAPGGYQNGGYGGAAQGVQMQGKPGPGYMAPQPQPQYQMSSYGNNPGTVGWSTGLFDCMDDPTNAVVTCFCPCFTFGQIAEIVDSGQTTCGTSGILYGVILALIGAPCILSCTYRSKMRTQYDLLEIPAADWLTHCFCECCALTQEYRELKNRGLDPALGWHGNMMLKHMQQQQPQVAMTPPVNQTMAGPKMAR